MDSRTLLLRPHCEGGQNQGRYGQKRMTGRDIMEIKIEDTLAQRRGQEL
jgi:hypothetical protein